MTPTTRRRLFVLAVIGLLALPVEAVLLPVARTPEPAAAALEWVDRLAADDLGAAAADIQAYPVRYRRAIMTALTPVDRAGVWQQHFQAYLVRNPQLSAEGAAVIERAAALVASETFELPVRPELQDQIDAIFADAIETLGEDAARDLFVDLGPKDVRHVNALPLRQRLADSVRSWRVASARFTDCNCSPDLDTCDLGPDPWLECSELFTCEFDIDWPMCGPFWSWGCTGWCAITDEDLMEMEGGQ